jgi:hypothetical protein
MSPGAIRLRITTRETRLSPGSDPREAFWAVARDESDSNESISALEAKLCRLLGPELRETLIRQLAMPLRTLDSELFPGSLRDFEHWMFRFMDGPGSSREWYRYQFAEAFAKLMEQRQQVLRESLSALAIDLVPTSVFALASKPLCSLPRSAPSTEHRTVRPRRASLRIGPKTHLRRFVMGAR